MNPIDFPEANRTFTKPPSMTDEECLPLHVHDDGEQFVSRWQPTEEERRAIAAGASVRLAIVGRGHPPVWVDVDVAGPAPAPPTLQEVGAAFAERLRRGGAAPDTVAFFEWAVETTIARYLGWPLPPDPRDATIRQMHEDSLAAVRETARERDAALAELARERELREDRERDRASWREGCERWNGAANDLAAALLEAMAAVQVFHGRVGWELYRDHAPEMERWRGLLEKVGAEIPSALCIGAVAMLPREEPPRG